MAQKAQTRGKCVFCGQEYTGSGMSTHLRACAARKAAIEKANGGGRPIQSLYHLRVKSVYSNDHWLHLEARGSAWLSDIDYYLRAIWLECCGHLSAFSIGGPWTGDEVAPETRSDRIFSSVQKLSYVYDFGTSSELELHVVGERRGRSLSNHPIYLMARNNPPGYTCDACGAPATRLLYHFTEHDMEAVMVCDAHLQQYLDAHPEDEDYQYNVVNSPRMGMCGYNGPAEPPY